MIQTGNSNNVRKTAKYYRDALAKGYTPALITEIITRFGGKDKKIRLARENTRFVWNHRIDSFGICRSGRNKGQVWIGVYWQGDSTDGNDCVLLDDFRYRNEVVIPAEHFFECGRTYERHSDICIGKDELNEAVKAIIPWLSTENIRARRDYEVRSAQLSRFWKTVLPGLSDYYGGRSCWREDRERFDRNRQDVEKYIETHFDELKKLHDDKFKETLTDVFKESRKVN